MSNDIFGLGGFMKGLGFGQQDDPDTRLMMAQNELGELQQKETGVYIEIGRQAYAANPGFYPQGERLRMIQSEISAAENKLAAAKAEKEQAQRKQQAADARCTCPNCGHRNPDGMKFCQECGTKLEGGLVCRNCGEPLQTGIRFCGACGTRRDDM